MKDGYFTHRKSKFSTDESSTMYRKCGCIVKKKQLILQGKIEICTWKTRFSIEENSIMYRKCGCILKKKQFLQHERLIFCALKTHVFCRRK